MRLPSCPRLELTFAEVLSPIPTPGDLRAKLVKTNLPLGESIWEGMARSTMILSSQGWVGV